jgi:hypothetical protein
MSAPGELTTRSSRVDDERRIAVTPAPKRPFATVEVMIASGVVEMPLAEPK